MNDDTAKELPHYAGHRERLRQRYLKNGIDSLTQYEAMELLLTYAITRRDVKPMAKALIKKFKGIRGVLDADVEELTAINGIGIQAALLLKLIKDINTIYLKEKLITGQIVESPNDIIDYLKHAIGSLKEEMFMALFLNSKNEIVADEIISEGIVNHAVVYPRKLFENALKHKATAIIIVHNHPGGVLKPSENDIKLTKNLVNTANSLSIKIHDHLIVTNKGYLSFYEKGLI
ncbi:MAG: DNA repair protein RadC [Candidatus Magnetoovum sp. WYHC-5]|nr:DNA repair protein RadC [Candidatus Magnetoovum sp. WYHC-5]